MRGEVRDELKSENLADDAVSVEKQQEILLMNKLASGGRLPPKTQSNFLQKKLQQRKFFDSGDYAMNRDKEKKHHQPAVKSIAESGTIPPPPAAPQQQSPQQQQQQHNQQTSPQPPQINVPTSPTSDRPSGAESQQQHVESPPQQASVSAVPISPDKPESDEEEHLQIPRPETVPKRKASILHPSVHSKLSPQPLFHHEHHTNTDELSS